MFRFLPTPLLALTLSAAVAAPVPKAKEAARLWPTAVGTKWEYVRNGDEHAVAVEEITEASEKGGVTTVTVAITPTAGAKRVNKLEVRADGMYVAEVTGLTIPDPFLAWKAGAKQGDTWTAKYTLTGGMRDIELVCTVGKPEEITTPAGTFTATPVTRKYTVGGDAEHVFWYADGVGLVRQTTNDRPVQELKSFTPAKEKK